jgi:hypothetical protein
MELNDITKEDIVKARQTVAAVKATLSGFGILTNNELNYKNILASVNAAADRWVKEVNDMIDFLAVKVGGNFVITSITLLAAIIGNKVLSWVDTVLSDLIFGNLIGGLYSLIAMVLSAIPGMEMYLQYLIAKELERQLRFRKKILILLNKDINNIIDLLQAYLSLFTIDGLSAPNELLNAIKSIKKAEQLLGIEIDKFLTLNATSIDKYLISNADEYIDKAIGFLSSGTFNRSKNEILAIKHKYLLTSNPPSNPSDVYGWGVYFKDLNVELKNRYVGDDAATKRLYISIIQDLFRAMPNLLKGLLLQQLFDSSCNRLLAKLPIDATQIKDLADIKKKFDSKLESAASTILNAGNTDMDDDREDAFFTSEETKNLTVRDLNNKVSINEGLLISFPELWNNLGTVGKLYMTFIEDSLGQLQSIREEIQEYWDAKNYEQIQLQVNKLKWVSELVLAKASLKPIISTNTTLSPFSSGNVGGVNGVDLNDLVVRGTEQLNKLKTFIINKKINPINKESRIEPSVKAYDLAQTTLFPLLTNIAIITSPQKTRGIIANLQSIKILFTSQIKLDSLELAYCTNFISFVEGHPAFPILKNMYDKFCKSLEKSPVGFVVKNLAVGDISEISNNLVTYIDPAIDIAQLILNGESKPAFLQNLIDSLSLGSIAEPTANELKRIQQELTTGTNSLKDKKDQLLLAYETALNNMSNINNTVIDTTSTVNTTKTNSNFSKTKLDPMQKSIEAAFNTTGDM